MKNTLFNGIDEVTNEEVIDKMKCFIQKADEGMNLYEKHKKESMQIAKELRKELEDEYKVNSTVKTEKIYQGHELFSSYYQPAIHEALVSITGRLSYEKLYGFLYDVKDYMNYYLPSKYVN